MKHMPWSFCSGETRVRKRFQVRCCMCNDLCRRVWGIQGRKQKQSRLASSARRAQRRASLSMSFACVESAAAMPERRKGGRKPEGPGGGEPLVRRRPAMEGDGRRRHSVTAAGTAEEFLGGGAPAAPPSRSVRRPLLLASLLCLAVLEALSQALGSEEGLSPFVFPRRCACPPACLASKKAAAQRFIGPLGEPAARPQTRERTDGRAWGCLNFFGGEEAGRSGGVGRGAGTR